MEIELFKQFQYELFAEAKRLVPITYDRNDLFFHDVEIYEKKLDKKFYKFKTSIRLLLIGLCGMKFDGKEYDKEAVDIMHSIEHHKKVVEHDNKIYKVKFEKYVDLIANDIINNKKIYKKKSVFELIPILAQKYFDFHNDEVEYTAIVLYLNSSLMKSGYKLTTTELSSLVNI